MFYFGEVTASFLCISPQQQPAYAKKLLLSQPLTVEVSVFSKEFQVGAPNSAHDPNPRCRELEQVQVGELLSRMMMHQGSFAVKIGTLPRASESGSAFPFLGCPRVFGEMQTVSRQQPPDYEGIDRHIACVTLRSIQIVPVEALNVLQPVGNSHER